MQPFNYSDLIAHMAVLLIGSTGNGKSTLGNFLLDPDCKPGAEPFKVATNNLPQTQKVEVKAKHIKVKGSQRQDLTIIDTPGLNESKLRDLEHMIELTRSLQEIKMVMGCAFVVKFSSKIDQQYRDTVEYYSKLLPSLFDKNVFIVVTDYATDPRSEAMRKRQGIDYVEIIGNIKKYIVSSSQIMYNPLVFTIDCLPFDEAELAVSMKARDAIMSYIFSLKVNSKDVSNLQVAKTKALMDEDEKLANKYEGEITGYNKRLQQTNEKSRVVLEEIQKEEHELTVAETKLVKLQETLDSKDSDETVSVGSWSVDDSWKLFRWHSMTFHIDAECDYTNVRKWTNGHCTFSEIKKDRRSCSGRCEGDFMRGLYASVTLETPKRLKFAIDVHGLRESVKWQKEECDLRKKIALDKKKTHEMFKKEIALLENFIAENRVKIKECATATLSLEKAHARFEELYAKETHSYIQSDTLIN